MNQVLPAPEDCSQPADENCNGPSADCSTGAWSKRFGDFDGQYGRTIAADSAGNVFVAGSFYSSIDFGAGAYTATGLDGFLVKLDPLGNVLWSKQFGGASSQKPWALAVDAVGNVVVTGGFAGTTDFGNGPVTANGGDIFLVKFDPTGKHLWSKTIGLAGDQGSETVAFDEQGRIVLGAVFDGAVDFGAGMVTTPNYAFAVAKFDADGNHLWSKTYDDSLGQPQLMTLAVDSSGNVAFGGYYHGTVDFGGGAFPPPGSSYDSFLVKLDANGQHLWSKRHGGALGQNPNGMGFDANGNIYAVGSFEGTIDLGGGNFTSAGNDDIWIVKYGPLGNHLWSKRYGDSDQQFATDMAVKKNGDLVFTVTLKGSADFGGGIVTSAGSYDLVNVRLDANGNHVWTRRTGDAGQQTSDSIAFDPTGHVLVTGELVGPLDFGTGVLTTAGSADLFIAKLLP